MATWNVIAGAPTFSDYSTSVAFSADSSLLAVGHTPVPHVTVIDTSDWSVVPNGPSVPDIVRDVAFSPDGAYLAVAHDDTPHMTVFATADWSVVSGVPVIGTGEFHRGTCVSFSDNGLWLAVTNTTGDKLTVLRVSDWSVVPGTPTFSFFGNTPNSVEFSVGSDYLAIGHSGGDYLTIVDTADWSTVAGTPSLPGSGSDVAFSADGVYLAIIYPSTPYITVLNTTDWSVVAGTPTLAGRGYGVEFARDSSLLGVAHENGSEFSIYSTVDWVRDTGTPNIDGIGQEIAFSGEPLHIAVAYSGGVQQDNLLVAALLIPTEMNITLQDTQASIVAEVDPAATIAISLDGTTIAIDAVATTHVNISSTLDDTTVAATGHYTSNAADITVNLADTRALINMRAAHYEDVTLSAETTTTLDTRDVQQLSLRSLMLTDTQTFYNPQQELTATALARLPHVVAYIESLALSGSVALTADTEHMLLLWLQARAEGTLETNLQRIFEGTLAALAGDDVVGAAAALVSEVGSAEGSVVGSIALELMDEVAAQLTAENTLFVSITETLEAEAGDSVQVLGQYSQNVKDMAGAWLVFKVSGEIIQGWVMNLEGERPFSQYSEFDFNSMTRIGSSYFAATDAGLYRLGGDTDAGSDIDAHIRSMMLDFDTSAQKRVVAAYLGYTSSGTVVLKVRSVDDGRLVEHWYEAVEVTAEAPRAGYRPLGRGLKSRYWQFELANVDGADFEIDKLELQPIQLSRRI